ncbi:MAG: LptF/LptG family permease [bacterium]
MPLFRRPSKVIATEASAPAPPEPRPDKTRRRLWSPVPILDRYIGAEIVSVTMFCIFGFAILIVGNNFYANAEFIFGKVRVPIHILGLLSLLEAPASMVRSLPLATTFGVMLAIGRMGRDSELIAIRSGGASLGRILAPILLVGIVLSVINFYAGENWVPKVGRYAASLRRTYIVKDNKLPSHRKEFFRSPSGQIIYTPVYDETTQVLQRPFMMSLDPGKLPGPGDDKLNFFTAQDGKFDGDSLVLGNQTPLLHQVFDRSTSLGWQLLSKEELNDPAAKRFPFPQEFQLVDKKDDKSDYQVMAEVQKSMEATQVVGKNPTKLRTDYAFRFATPIACTIFAYVAFIFGIVNPRREKFTGVFYALVTIFWYYILNAILKNLGYNGVISPPELAAWGANLIFLALATVMFVQMR